MEYYKKITRFWYIVVTFGIVYGMMNWSVLYCSAGSAFSGKKPKGVLATAVYNQIVVSWEPVTGAAGYEIYERTSPEKVFYVVEDSTKTKCVFQRQETGKTYSYYVRAYRVTKQGKRIYGKNSKTVSATIPEVGRSTIKNFLQVALAPVGTTMYVWGGGWNQADTGAGKEARQIGLSSKWRKFAANKTSRYNFRNYRYQIHDGLDCSGYVGWCVYNIWNVSDNRKGYVYSASKQAKKYADMGFGKYRERCQVVDFQAGDIMSSTCSCCGHVYIVIGQCADGSVVLLHASPPGVQISGTATPGGKQKSEAYRLAKKYMKKYYKNWYGRYPNPGKGTSYLTHYSQMRWKITGEDVVLSDPDGYRDMSPEDILKDLFGE